MTILMVTMLSFGLSSCSNDDDDKVVDTENEIIGTWKSYKAVVYGQGQSATVSISKTGEYSDSYIEITFEKGGKAIGYSWDEDENGLSQWMHETGAYTINGNSIIVTFDGETGTFTYDEKEKNLYIRGSVKTDAGDITTYIYLKK